MTTTNDKNPSAQVSIPELTLLSTFTKPRNAQTQSSLIILPTELRVKILRYLLKHDKPIASANPPSTENESETPPVETYLRSPKYTGFTLSSQVLGTCQLLHDEGSHVLYRENQLKIECVREHVNVLDRTFYFSNLWLASLGLSTSYDIWINDVESIGKSIQYPENSENEVTAGVLKFQRKDFQPIVDALYLPIAKFETKQIEIVAKDCNMFFAYCRAFQGLVKDSRLTLKMQIERTGTPNGQTSAPAHWLDSVKLLRTKEFKVNYSGDGVEPYRAIITGNEEVVDESKTLCNATKLRDQLVKMKGVNIKDARKAYTRLKSAVLACDRAAVNRHKATFETAAREATEKWKEQEEKSLKEETKNQKKNQEETMDLLNKLGE